MQRLKVNRSTVIVEKIQYYLHRNEEAIFINRLYGILFFLQEDCGSCDKTSSILGLSPRTISNWIKRVNSTGDIESLRSKPRMGRPSRLDAKQKMELKSVLQESPEKSGMTSNLWDGKTLSAYIFMHYGISLKVRACQNLLHSLGFSLKRARPVVAKADEKKKEESRKTSIENTNR
ncbi:MAG: winged helix-turn-helix domain-containing protein [Prevotellaceae bacterium]|jgi:transposase|nr:winged helix-turn-helix domain-containing protein [Prevotellaceae bacterium]